MYSKRQLLRYHSYCRSNPDGVSKTGEAMNYSSKDSPVTVLPGWSSVTFLDRNGNPAATEGDFYHVCKMLSLAGYMVEQPTAVLEVFGLKDGGPEVIRLDDPNSVYLHHNNQRENEMKTEFAQVLGCKEKFVDVRLVFLGHFNVCNRCGGSGHYSFNLMHGTTCFGCNGAGKKPVKLTAKLLGKVSEQVQAGELKPYLEANERRARAKRWMDRFFTAWKSQPETILNEKVHFTRQSNLSSEINHICAAGCDELRKIVTEVEYGRFAGRGKPVYKLNAEELANAESKAESLIAMAGNSQATAEAKLAW